MLHSVQVRKKGRLAARRKKYKMDCCGQFTLWSWYSAEENTKPQDI